MDEIKSATLLSDAIVQKVSGFSRNEQWSKFIELQTGEDIDILELNAFEAKNH